MHTDTRPARVRTCRPLTAPGVCLTSGFLVPVLKDMESDGVGRSRKCSSEHRTFSEGNSDAAGRRDRGRLGPCSAHIPPLFLLSEGWMFVSQSTRPWGCCAARFLSWFGSGGSALTARCFPPLPTASHRSLQLRFLFQFVFQPFSGGGAPGNILL